MKLIWILEDESWFWVLDESGRTWECWYEEGDTPPVRLPKMDRRSITAVTDMMGDMAQMAMDEIDNVNNESLNK